MSGDGASQVGSYLKIVRTGEAKHPAAEIVGMMSVLLETPAGGEVAIALGFWAVDVQHWVSRRPGKSGPRTIIPSTLPCDASIYEFGGPVSPEGHYSSCFSQTTGPELPIILQAPSVRSHIFGYNAGNWGSRVEAARIHISKR